MIDRKHRNFELIWCIGFFMLIPIWIGLAPVWYNWYIYPENGYWIKWLYGLLDGRWLVNVPICIGLGYLTVRWCCRVWTDMDIRLYRPILAILGIVVLYCGSNVEYANVVGCLDYRVFVTLLITGSLLVMIIKACRIIKVSCRVDDGTRESKEKINDAKPHPKGFSVDKTNEDDIPETLKNYADEIIERLLVTDIQDKSYALGVTGEWGVGKTTFLEVLKKKINGRADVVEFNPWMCSSPEQVTNDFFASLQHQLSPKYSTLSRSIKEYAKYINSVTLSPHSALSLDVLLPVKQESLFERKKALSKKFANLPKPVVVIIDDVDRLERDEVFEVLRLIRNTADLSNVIYMVAYDKEYVTCVLEEKNIKDSSAYLEKIFPIEVHLPKVEDRLVWDTLYSEINQQSNFNANFAQMLLKNFKSDDKELILKVLNNYRRAKRFARLFVLNIAYVNHHAKGELKILDVFWLELLQMYDKRTYDVLADDSSLLIYHDDGRLRLRDGILQPASDKDLHTFQGKPFWKEETPKIMEKMFGMYIKTIQQSICYAENYDKFFTLSISQFRLSIAEMRELFADGVKADEVVEKWVEGGKYLSSIVYQFKQINVNKLNDAQLKNYLHGLLGFGMKVSLYRNTHVWELKEMLRVDRCIKGVEDKAHDIVLEWIKEKSKDDKSRPYLSKMLNCFYTTIVVNPEGHEEKTHPLVISNNEVEKLLRQLMRDYLSCHPEETALSVMSEKGIVAYIFKNCCVTVRDEMATENYCEYRQVAFDTVIDHFSKKESKPPLEEYENALGAMFYEKAPAFDNEYEEDQYWDYASETYENKMQEYFGNLYDRKPDGKLLEFKEKCFVVKNNQTDEA